MGKVDVVAIGKQTTKDFVTYEEYDEPVLVAGDTGLNLTTLRTVPVTYRDFMIIVLS